MPDTNLNNKRLADIKTACKYGKFGRSKFYELLAAGRIDAYKFDHKTLVDLDSIDRLHAALKKIKPGAAA